VTESERRWQETRAEQLARERHWHVTWEGSHVSVCGTGGWGERGREIARGEGPDFHYQLKAALDAALRIYP
jgi:hypothetical protein